MYYCMEGTVEVVAERVLIPRPMVDWEDADSLDITRLANTT
jgi:hypothetical protein